jgi:hypothetical protein
MKHFPLFLALLVFASLACGLGTPTPVLDIHAVQTIAAITLTAIGPIPSPTQLPPTLVPVPTLTLVPSATPIPTLTPPAVTGPIRIQFEPGGNSATVSNTVTFPGRIEYILRAARKQQMTIVIVSPGDAANFSVVGMEDGSPLKRLENEDRTWVGNLPATQDYLIAVAVPSGSAAFTLTVIIIWP